MAKKRTTQAVVPFDDQPYSIPKNWKWVRLSVLLDLSKDKTEDFSEQDLKYVGLEHMEKDLGIISYGSAENIRSIKSRFRKGQILYGRLRPYLNKHGIATFDGICSTDILVFDTTPITTSQYVDYYFNLPDFIQYAVNNSKGINLPRVSAEAILQSACPLPPILEQERMINRIQGLFEKLDEAKEKAQSVIDGFEDRKAVILYRAISGDLTANWRKDHGLSRDEWNLVQLKDVCKINPPKIDSKYMPEDLEVSFFPMPALSEISGEITEPQTRRLSEVKSGFTNFLEGDVVFAKITPCMENGKSAVIGPLVNGIGFGTTEFFVMRCGEKLLNRYLWHIVRDRAFREKAKAAMTGAVGQQRVPKSYLEDYQIYLPPIEEQKAIVKLLDTAFENELQVKQTAEKTIERIDVMKKTILAKAFRGELGTNNPTELPVEL